MLLSKSTVFQDLQIDPKSYDLLKKETGSAPMKLSAPRNEYSLFSLVTYMLDDRIYPVLYTKPVFDANVCTEELRILNLGLLCPEESCLQYQDMWEDVCAMYLYTDAEAWNSEYHVFNLNPIHADGDDMYYRYTFRCHDNTLSYSFIAGADKMIFNSFKLVMALSYQAAAYNREDTLAY